MRRGIIFSVLFILSIIFSFTAFAAEETEIEVWIDGEQLQFEEEPFIERSTTLVPFRALFSELGLDVKWDQETKTVTGENADLTVELTLNSNLAKVNGEVIEMLVMPQLINNHTFVPLRFVGESTGAKVQWDAATKTISITSPESKVNDEELILALFEQYLTSSNEKNLTELLEVFNEQYEINSGINLKEVFSYFYEKYDVETTIEELEIIEIDNEEAIVYAIEVYERRGGSFYVDNRQEIIYTLHKNKDGLWKISEDEIQKMENINLEKLKDIQIEVPSKDEKKIMNTLKQYFRALDNGDAGLFISTFHEDSIISEDLGGNEETMRLIFEFVEYSDLEMDHTSLVSFFDEDYIGLYVIHSFESTYYDEELDEEVTEIEQNVNEIFHFKKSMDGSWKILFVETLDLETN
ncbi:stalk domain-containing protein [Chengkuizengella sediminis]|uniref:stalk domain-containing protein n=1 Tax=Chengkuizengella sediminis TaxID=1885917 RepID=UPI0013896B73|nr:stalk domain-containing protein [Chengkuizengella sediminis]NDI36682.1 hypothetical protein [Chengkuizengella sediminis]